MKPAELEEARLGFTQYLRRKGFSPQFITQNGDDLFATATLEYSRKVVEGAEIESPAAWLIACATQRTKNLLTSEGRTPNLVSTERAPVLVDDRDQGPEDVALEEDRFRKVRRAVAELSEEERLVIERAYFEDLPVREIARTLDWHPSKAQHRHESARKHLHELLGVESLDELELEIGLAAYVSFIGAHSGIHPMAGIEGTIEGVQQGASWAWLRVQDLARRLPFGGGNAEPSATAAALQSSGAGRAIAVCATVVVTGCIGVAATVETGVFGGGGDRQSKPAEVAQTHESPPIRIRPAPAQPAPSARTHRRVGAQTGSASSGRRSRYSRNPTPVSSKSTEGRRRLAHREGGVEAAGESEEVAVVAPESEESATSEPVASPSSSPSPSASARKSFAPGP
ncbi:MAG TPA: sigma-70 family RNA polymerase sigma factor [Solirubrobacterales bacterium]|nr:sigma-70 family RNA polymerase sigma factor [Solirubrobacterales bacterium]